MNQGQMEVRCRCGRVSAPIVGQPIMRAICYCTSCRTAGTAFEQALGASSVVDDDGGTDLVLYRKDRVGSFMGGSSLREHRLTPTSPTRRVVATCCNTPIFLDFTNGHWLSIYADSILGTSAALDMRVMTSDRLEQAPLPEDVPHHAKHPAGFMVKLLAAWAAMRFHRPKVVW